MRFRARAFARFLRFLHSVYKSFDSGGGEKDSDDDNDDDNDNYVNADTLKGRFRLNLISTLTLFTLFM